MIGVLKSKLADIPLLQDNLVVDRKVHLRSLLNTMFSIWTWSLVIALVAVLYVVNRQIKGTADVNCPTFYMNSTSLHPDIYIPNHF